MANSLRILSGFEPPSSARPPAPTLLSGELAQLSLPELLQTFEHGRRSGVIRLRAPGCSASLWLRHGRVLDASIEGGPDGAEAVYALVPLEQGTFELTGELPERPDRIQQPTTALLLEAMRRQDEARRAAAPPFAALEDPPPLPARPLRVAHRALTLLNVAAAFAREIAEPRLVEARLESTRSQLMIALPVLARLAVRPGPAVTFVDGGDPVALPAPDALVVATAAWLRSFFAAMEHAFPGRFSLHRLRQCTEAVQDDLHDLEFYAALGFEDP